MAKVACPTEQKEQEAVFAWARNLNVLRARPELEMLISTQPGLRTNIGAAMKAKRAGMPRGFPDLALFVPKAIVEGLEIAWHHGLLVELKRTKGGVVSAEQLAWGTVLRKQGYAWAVCEGAKHAIATIEKYLDGEL